MRGKHKKCVDAGLIFTLMVCGGDDDDDDGAALRYWFDMAKVYVCFMRVI